MTTVSLLNVFRRIFAMSNKGKIEIIKENAEIAKRTIGELKQEVSYMKKK